MSTRDIGKYGENLAVAYLESLNYRIVNRNVFCRYGEVDIIALKDHTIHFIEVKYVSSEKFCLAVDLYTMEKRKKFLKAILYLLNTRKKLRLKWQADLICITNGDRNIWINMYNHAL